MAPLGSHAISLQRHALIIGSQIDRLSVYFHELVHLIVQPPFARLGEVPEEWILFQLERCLSRRTLPASEQFLVEKWQRETFLSLNSRKTLGDIPDFEDTAWWHEGFRLCQQLGLIAAAHQPTFQPANWDALDDNALKRWWVTHGPELIERQLTIDPTTTNMPPSCSKIGKSWCSSRSSTRAPSPRSPFVATTTARHHRSSGRPRPAPLSPARPQRPQQDAQPHALEPPQRQRIRRFASFSRMRPRHNRWWRRWSVSAISCTHANLAAPMGSS